ncbi:MAG: RluA family pseudouridine synthase, partial [Planctomycetes bacterium]|nr:RluA family pseudouridine synthase [Planctomycetota bacterium]
MSEKQQRQLVNLSLVETRTDIDVDEKSEGKRVDQVIQKRLSWLSRAKIKQSCEERRVLRNGQPVPSGRRVKAGDKVVLIHPEPYEDLTDMDRITWGTLFEDEFILVINKPPHLVVHPAGAYRYTTLLNALHKKYLGDKREVFEQDRVPRLVHRIDKETSGVLVAAFEREAHGILGKLFQVHSDAIEKEYIALVEGRIEWDEQDVEANIGIPDNDTIRIRRCVREDGQYARTTVKVLERFAQFSLVRCKLHTGRQHQIRLHMQHLGHPLVGDHLYGVRDELREADISSPDTPAFRYGQIYLDDSVSNIEASDRIREVDFVKRREYWDIEAGREIYREGFGRLLLSRCALHCARMVFPHPVSDQRMSF